MNTATITTGMIATSRNGNPIMVTSQPFHDVDGVERVYVRTIQSNGVDGKPRKVRIDGLTLPVAGGAPDDEPAPVEPEPYTSSKFTNAIAEHLYTLSLEGCHDEECGDVETIGHHALFKGGFSPDGMGETWDALTHDQKWELIRCAGAIVTTCGQGFVDAVVYDTPMDLDQAWDWIQEQDSDDDEPTDDDGIQDEDYVTEDYVTFQEHNGNGRFVVEPWDDFRFALAEEFDRNRFYPNVWHVSDHGNVSLVDMAIPDGTTRPTRPHGERVELSRMDDGKLPAFAWPGGYPLYYLAKDCEAFCPGCANGENGSDCGKSSDDDWHLIAVEPNYEDPDLYCVHCNNRIESAHAEPCNAEKGSQAEWYVGIPMEPTYTGNCTVYAVVRMRDGSYSVTTATVDDIGGEPIVNTTRMPADLFRYIRLAPIVPNMLEPALFDAITDAI